MMRWVSGEKTPKAARAVGSRSALAGCALRQDWSEVVVPRFTLRSTDPVPPLVGAVSTMLLRPLLSVTAPETEVVQALVGAPLLSRYVALTTEAAGSTVQPLSASLITQALPDQYWVDTGTCKVFLTEPKALETCSRPLRTFGPCSVLFSDVTPSLSMARSTTAAGGVSLLV